MEQNIKICIGECTGCGVCAAICPKKAVSMMLNEKGYFSAHIRDDLCIKCGKCFQVCPIRVKLSGKLLHPAQSIYYAYHNNKKIRYQSSSGGIATAIASSAIEHGYVVIGAAYCFKDNKVHHVIIKNIEELVKITGSKYLPSDTVDAFSKIKNLDKIMVIGTPCQICALRLAYPDKDMLMVDFRCFGPVDYNLWDRYLKYLNKINDSGIKKINFRAKNNNWLIWGIEVEFCDGNIYKKNKLKDPFGVCFSGEGYALENCLKCRKFKQNSYADIRLEDAWNLLDYVDDDALRFGASQVTIYSNKGIKFWHLCKSNIFSKSVPIKYDIHSNPELHFNRRLFDLILSNKEKALDEIVYEYRKGISFYKKVYVLLCNFLLYNRRMYTLAKKIMKRIRKFRRKKA